MLQRRKDNTYPQRDSRRWSNLGAVGLGAVGLGLYLVTTVSGAGCGVGTDPSLLTGADATTAPQHDAATDTSDAASSSTVPDGIPPMDQRTYTETAVATFALG